jgi:hypothetical protein
VGQNWECVAEITDVEDVETLGPVVVNASRIVAALESRPSPSAIKAAVREYHKEADALAAVLTGTMARRLRNNVDWLQRVRDFVDTKVLDKAEFKNSSGVPEWWDPAVHPAELFGRLYSSGLWNLPEFLLSTDSFSTHFTDDDKEYVSSLTERAKKYGWIKTAKGPLAVLLQEDQVVQLIEDLIRQTGGWNVPAYIDVPEVAKSGIELPLAYGDVLVESIGDGPLLIIDDVLLKAGFRARVRHKGVGYRCSVLDEELFEIWKSDRAKWTGQNPTDAWTEVDPDFDADGLSAFGLRTSVVQYEYLRELNDDEIEGYVKPNIVFYQTEVVIKTARRKPTRFVKTPKPKPKRRKESSSESEFDESYDETG